MAVEYDLVVIGASQGGIEAALRAAYLQARVAIVEQQINHYSPAEAEVIYSRIFRRRHLSCQEEGSYPFSVPISWTIKEEIEEILGTIAASNSPAQLSVLGVDYIVGKGEFSATPELAFVVNQRRLRSRSFLLATGSVVGQANFLGESDFLTLEDIWQQNELESLPTNLLIAGSNILTLELAQVLCRLGKQITLVAPEKQILPAEDREVSSLVKAHLEAEGINIFNQSPIIQIKEIEGQKWVQAGNHALEAEEIILSLPRQAAIEELNLASVGVEVTKRGLKVNQKLQTTNPRIYACGEIIGGYSLAHIARYEAKIAVKNILFAPIYQVNYQALPWTIFREPQAARVGLTEAQARRIYDRDITVVKHYFKYVPQAQIDRNITGFCKIITKKNGHILGVHLVGNEAGELINIFALGIKNSLPISSLANLVNPTLTYSEVIEQTINLWWREKFQQRKRLRGYLSDFFAWRRDFSS